MWLACAVGVAILVGGTDARTLGSDLVFPEKVEARGEIRAHLQRAYDRLCAPPMDDLPFVLSDVNFHFTRRFTQYSGDVSGRMLGALNATDPVLGTHTPMIEQLETAFPQYQKADGHFGADQDLKAGVKGERDMPILWGNGRLLLALAERYRTTPNPQLLDMAKRIGDYIISTRPYFGLKENFTKVGGAYSSGYTTCYPSLIDGLAALGQISGEDRYYEEARFIARLSLLDSEFKNHHSHGRLSAYRGMLDLDRFTGQPEFLDIVRTNCETIVQDYMLPTGGITERFDRHDQRDEGCTEADWVRVNLLLWQMTGEMKYLDRAECALRNHVLATQISNGGFGHHIWRKLKDSEKEYTPGAIHRDGTDAYWCCAMHCTQILAEIPQWSVLAQDGKVLLTWLADTKATLKIDDNTITVTTDKTASDTWRVTVDAKKPTVLRMRVPNWAKSIIINNTRVDSEDRWAEHKIPAGETTLTVTLPNRLRIVGAFGDKVVEGEPVRLFSGPDLLCLPERALRPGFISPDAIPTLIFAATTDGWLANVTGSDGTGQLARLVPMAERPADGCRFLFFAREAKDENELTASAAEIRDPGIPIEILTSCDGLYEMYLNGRLLTRRTARVSWVESPCIEEYTQPGRNVIAFKLRRANESAGLICQIRSAGRTHVTNVTDWTAIPCPQKLPPQWLKDASKGSGHAVTLADKGGFGAAPWLHVPGAFAGLGARWIWPDESDNEKKRWWLVRYEFEVSDKDSEGH